MVIDPGLVPKIIDPVDWGQVATRVLTVVVKKILREIEITRVFAEICTPRKLGTKRPIDNHSGADRFDRGRCRCNYSQ